MTVISAFRKWRQGDCYDSGATLEYTVYQSQSVIHGKKYLKTINKNCQNQSFMGRNLTCIIRQIINNENQEVVTNTCFLRRNENMKLFSDLESSKVKITLYKMKLFQYFII